MSAVGYTLLPTKRSASPRTLHLLLATVWRATRLSDAEWSAPSAEHLSLPAIVAHTHDGPSYNPVRATSRDRSTLMVSTAQKLAAHVGGPFLSALPEIATPD
jgi:hypothetical protein